MTAFEDPLLRLITFSWDYLDTAQPKHRLVSPYTSGPFCASPLHGDGPNEATSAILTTGRLATYGNKLGHLPRPEASTSAGGGLLIGQPSPYNCPSLSTSV
jgi:hypothetical protein